LSSLESLQGGRYVILKKLGESGRAVVYKVRDTVLNRVAAVKVFKSAFLSEEARSRFMQEALAVAKLNHPNIVSIDEVSAVPPTAKELGIKSWVKGESKVGEKPLFVLEFVDGTSLRDLLRTYPEGKCDIQTVLRVGIDVCGALHYAHSQGILHRDIKPENVMLTREDTAKLMDLGLAEMFGELSLAQEGVIVGTVAYVAPELASGRSGDARSDLYSFGVVLYEMVTGKPPFVGEDSVKVIFSHIHDHPVSPSRLNPKVPSALSDCIMRLLEKEPEKRFQSAADLLKVLRDIAEGFLREAYGPSAKGAVVVPAPRPVIEREIQLINRTGEMALLREAVDKAVGGEGGLVFLYGEPGIGKTRLTRELGAYARLRGMQVVYGRCPALFRMDGVPPYVLWSEVIRNYLEDCNPEQLYRVVGYYPSEVCKLVPDLANRLRAIPPSVPISPEHERDRLFEAVSQFVTNISREAPLLVVLDDLQWTDQSSLLLMHYLARGVYRVPMLILGAYRDTDIDERHVLSSVLTELNRERLLKSLPLKRMSTDDVSEMIKRLLEQDEVPEAFCELVYEKTRGNPFFVEEVVKSLREEEVIYRGENQWKVKEVSKIEFPSTVKSVVKARIGRLDDECQSLLTLASFVGNDFSFEALCGVTGFAEDKVLDLMDQMLKTGLVKERVIRGQDVYSFADIIVRDVAHEEVSHLRHRKLHGTVGSALEKVYERKIDEHLGELALHFLEFGDEDKALGYFLKAGDRAVKIYANTEAVSYFQHALDLLEKKEGEPREKARVLEKLGDIKSLGGEYDIGTRYWNEALELWSQLYEKENVARLHRKMANVLWENKGDTVKAEEHYNKALSILEGKPESVELASLYEDMAHMYYRTKDMTKSQSLAEKALELGKKLGDYEVIANSYVSLGTVFHKIAELKKAVDCMERGLKIALDNGLMETALRAYNNLAAVLPMEEVERAEGSLEKGYELAKKIGHIQLQSFMGTNIAWDHLGRGDVKKALSLVEESVALDRKSGNMVNLSYSIGILALAHFLLGDWDKCGEYLKEKIRITEKLNDIQQTVSSYMWLGFLHFSKGEYAESRVLYEKGYEINEKAGAKFSQMWSSTWVIWSLIELGELEKANNLLEKLYEFASKVKDRELLAWTDARKGMMFRAQKKWEDSIQCFEKSFRELEALGYRRHNVYGLARMLLCEYARVYLERNQKGDREKALNLLNQALEIFEKMGAKKEIENILTKKRLLTA